jgi:uncharacterized protein
VRIRIHDIEESPKEFLWEEPTDELNEILAHGPVHDYTFAGPAAVQVRYYRAGLELFFSGRAVGPVLGSCARCLDPFSFRLDVPYAFVLVPHGHRTDDDQEEEDVNLSYYRGHEVDLSPLIREQVVLSLPMQPLCRDDCRGLCNSCGANLNVTACSCTPPAPDPRFAALRVYRARSPQ